MEGKKIAICALLIAVAIVATVIAVKRFTSGPTPPSWLLDQRVEKIDRKTLELVTESVRDWSGKYAPDASGRYKNPKTGEYTMVGVMKCAACGQFILPPDYSAAYAKNEAGPTPAAAVSGLKGKTPPMRFDVDAVKMREIRRGYRCPKCGKSPF